MIIGIIYKPPDIDVNKFNQSLESTLEIITKERRPCYLMGDFNINLLKHNVHTPTKVFLETMLTHGFFPLINKPTRITSESVSLIDNIFTNIHDQQSKSGIWIVDISDHLPVFTILPIKINNCDSKKQIRMRPFTLEKMDIFKNYLQFTDWSGFNDLCDVNSMYTAFINTVQNVYDKSFPIITKTLKATEIYKPWITKAIKNSINKKRCLYKKFLKLRSKESFAVYKAYRNKLTTILRKAEKMNYLHKLESAQGNCTKTWKILNQIISRTIKKDHIQEIVQKNEIICDPKMIADNFNKFFVNIGPNLAAKIPQTTHHFTEYLTTNKISNSLFLKPIKTEELEQVTHSLKNSNSKGYDNLSVNIIKQCISQLSKPLCFIFNKSIEVGIVPNQLKIAKIIPVYKSEDKKLVSNYRPISILPVFSKILERLIYNRLIHFLEQNNILSDNQYGFRKKISSSMALIDLIEKISSSMENNDYTLGIFLDLSKAFDTVNHDILLSKLHSYGIRGVPHDWFRNYLSNRSQYVSINNSKSDNLLIKCGVPQGSILGPLLFLLYINDLDFISKIITLIMFADDTNIFISGHNLESLSLIANTELKKLGHWFSANLLSLNIKKTNYILFSNTQLPNIPLRLNTDSVIRVYETKFLGVVIQSNLKWNTHIGIVKNKICKSIGIMNKAKNILASAHLKILYHSLIEPYLNYCCIVWGSPEKNINLESLLKLQKRGLRIILHTNYRAHSRPLFHKLKILNIYDLCRSQIVTFVYRSTNNLLPLKYTNYFIRADEVHPHTTRGTKNNNLFRTNAKKSCRINALICRGPKYWNTLPISLKSIYSLNLFKAKLKDHLMFGYQITL